MSTLRRLWSRPLTPAIVTLLLPFVVLAVRALVDDAPSPSGDVAIIEVRVADVGTGRTPLLGSYGRFGFNHPGPLLFYALAIPYRILGSRFAGMEIAALVLGGLSVAAIARVAFRRGGRLGLLWAVVVLAVFLRGVGPAWLLDPWEPHVLPLIAAALAALAFDAVAGRAAALPMAAGAASMLAQSWATLLPLAVGLGGWAAAGLIVAAGRGDRARRDVARAFGVTAVVIAVLWAPPLLQELTNARGNLSAMVDALDAPEPPLGVVDGWRAVTTELGHRASWLGFPQALDGLSPTLDLDTAPAIPVALVALLAGLGLSLRRRSRSRAWLLGVTALVAIGAATFALARLLGPIYVWIPQWLRVIGMTTWFAAGWCAFAGLPDEVRSRARVVLEPVLAAAGILLLSWTVVDAVSFDRAADPLGATIRRLVAAVDDDELGEGPVLATSTADANLALGGTDVGVEILVLAVERRGVETAVAAELAHQFGPDRARPARATTELRLVRADDAVPAGFDVVAEADPLPAAVRARRSDLLDAADLPRDATDADVLRRVAADPSLRSLAERVRRLPDLPVLRLVRRDADVSR